jgi:hypothetical protein
VRFHTALGAPPRPAEQPLAHQVVAVLNGSCMVRHMAWLSWIERQHLQHDGVQQSQEHKQNRGVSQH